MAIKLSCKILLAAALSVLSSTVPLRCLGQAPPKGQPASATHQAIRAEQPPFDKLELFGFFAAGPHDTYASQVIEARGANFTPDTAFIASFSIPAFQVMLRSIRPRAAGVVSPDRDAAYELLRRARDARQSPQFAATTESYRQALRLAPNSATLHLVYADSLLLSQDYPAAEAHARESVKLWPEYADAHASLALSLTAQKQFTEGESESKEALRIFPEHHGAMLALGVSLTHEARYEEAIPLLRKLIAALPKIADSRKLLGISLVETGEIDEGTSQLNIYVKNALGDAEGHYYLGVALRLKGRSEEARSQFAEAFRLQPNSPLYEVAAHPDATRNETDAVSGFENGSFSENVYTNRFFDFTYEFPKGWAILSADTARAALESGEALTSIGDPIEADIRKVMERKRRTLLYVAESSAGNKPILLKSVIVMALDIGAVPELSPESVLKSLSIRFKQSVVRMVVNEEPKKITISGRTFWNATFAGQTGMGSLYSSYFVTADRGCLLMFVVVSLDPGSLHEIEKLMGSIHFLRARADP